MHHPGTEEVHITFWAMEVRPGDGSPSLIKKLAEGGWKAVKLQKWRRLNEKYSF